MNYAARPALDEPVASVLARLAELQVCVLPETVPGLDPFKVRSAIPRAAAPLRRARPLPRAPRSPPSAPRAGSRPPPPVPGHLPSPPRPPR